MITSDIYKRKHYSLQFYFLLYFFHRCSRFRPPEAEIQESNERRKIFWLSAERISNMSTRWDLGSQFRAEKLKRGSCCCRQLFAFVEITISKTFIQACRGPEFLPNCFIVTNSSSCLPKTKWRIFQSKIQRHFFSNLINYPASWWN